MTMIASLQASTLDRPPSALPQGGRSAALEPGPRFAELMLRGSTHGVLPRPAQLPPVQAEQPPREAEPEHEAPTEERQLARTRAARAGAKPPARGRDKAAAEAPRAAAAPAAEAGAASSPRRAEASPAETPPAATVPALLHAELREWRAALGLPQRAAETEEPGRVDAAGQAVTAGSLGGSEIAADATEAGLDNPGGPDKSGASPSGNTSCVLALPATAAAAAADTAERRVASAEPATLRDAPAALLGGAAGAVPRGYDAATLAPIALPTPLYSPDFARALGAQVSLLARDGVQQAELHLNPADMGPISVQIELDGQQARVDFSADAARTREIIERGLPELAAAMREQGLTLAGGGVSQQAPERRDGAESPAGARRGQRRGVDAAAAALRPSALPRAQGIVDLYA